MTTRIINDGPSLQRLGMLLDAMELKSKMCNIDAEAHRKAGSVHDAYDSQMKANHADWVAYRTRAYMATLNGLSLDDAEQLAAIQVKTAGLVAAGVLLPDDDEPPLPLVDLTAWLRGKVGGWLPWVRSETWQTVAMLLMRGRP